MGKDTPGKWSLHQEHPERSMKIILDPTRGTAWYFTPYTEEELRQQEEARQK